MNIIYKSLLALLTFTCFVAHAMKRPTSNPEVENPAKKMALMPRIVSKIPQVSAVETITLVANNGKEFKVPKAIALQAGTIKGLLEAHIASENTGRIDFQIMDEETLVPIVNFMWHAHKHSALKGKQLLDALANESTLYVYKPQSNTSSTDEDMPYAREVPFIYTIDFISFLEAANFLDFQLAAELAAYLIARSPRDPDRSLSTQDVEALAERLPNMAAHLARYHFLVRKVKLRN